MRRRRCGAAPGPEQRPFSVAIADNPPGPDPDDRVAAAVGRVGRLLDRLGVTAVKIISPGCKFEPESKSSWQAGRRSRLERSGSQRLAWNASTTDAGIRPRSDTS